MAAEPNVWKAQAAEAQTVAKLLTEFRDDMGHSWPPDESFRDSVTRMIRRDDTEYWLASVEAGAPAAAVCQLRFRPSVWTAADDCWLEDLFVRDDARRHGLGRALVARSLDRARERGCRRVELDTNEDNDGAIRLYESLGFSARSKGESRSLFMGVALDR